MNMPVEKIEKPQLLDLSPKTFDEAWRFCEIVTSSGLCPKGFEKKPADAFIAIQWGSEVGLKALQALQNIAVINGRPSLWGDAVIAIVRASPLCEYVKETDDGHTATCKVKRRGEAEEIRTFSMDDAKTAGLMGKQGPWTQYPKRMRQMRARAFALRDVFPDVLKGMPIAEELMDYSEPEINPDFKADPEPHPENSAPAYPDAAFDRNFSKWKLAVEKGQSTHEQWINTLSAKGALTKEQLDRIHAVKAPIDGEVAAQ